MDKKRLTHLRDLLRADAANPKGVKFDLGKWAAWEDRGSSVINYDIHPVTGRPKQPIAMSCGTFACALGLAALDPAFNAQGLTLGTLDVIAGKSWMVPKYDGYDGFDAGSAFFGINEAAAKYLFDPDSYEDTPVEAEGELFVAQRIDDLINGIVDYDHYQGDDGYDDRDADDA